MPPASQTDGMEERYDPATKIWTVVFTAMVAGIVDWFAVVMPTQDDPPRDPVWNWWLAALIIAVLPALCWIAGHVKRREYEGMIIWIVPFALVVCAQFVLLEWSTS